MHILPPSPYFVRIFPCSLNLLAILASLEYCQRWPQQSEITHFRLMSSTFSSQNDVRTISFHIVLHTKYHQKNEKVQKLEDECDWYRKEALRLHSFNTAMKKDLKHMKGKMEIIGWYTRDTNVTFSPRHGTCCFSWAKPSNLSADYRYPCLK